MNSIRFELERVYQLVISEADLRAQTKLKRQQLELEQREAALAAAMELASVDGATRAAFHDGRMEERSRVLTLIDVQLHTLSRSGISHTVLTTLRRMVEGEP